MFNTMFNTEIQECQWGDFTEQLTEIKHLKPIAQYNCV